MEMMERLERDVGFLLKDLKLDPSSSDLRGTPKRVARMFKDELFKGLFTEPPEVTVFPNDEKYDEMIILRDIRVLSVCAHHLLPFTGRAHIAYIPAEKYCGISKLSRVVDWFARRPQIQERLTKQVADFLKEKLSPKGVMVVIEARHECMIVRGVQEDAAVMVTSVVHGAFEEKDARDEFLALIRKR